MKMIKILSMIGLLIVGALVYFNTQPEEKPFYSTEQLLQMEKERKAERRANGYAKQDAPDPIREDIAKIRVPIGESKTSGRSPNYIMEAYTQSKHSKTYKKDLAWQSRGPGNVGGRTRAIVVDKNDANQNTWIAASVGGGIWKTTDRGQTWTNLTDDQLPNLAFSSMVQSPSNPNILYAGSGEGFGNIDAIQGAGIFKSTDGGTTWTQIASTVVNQNFFYVNRLAINPSNANIVVAATNNGIYKTIDGGANWTTSLSSGSRVQDLQVNPNNFNIQIAAINADGIYKSTNAGTSFSKVSNNFAGGRIEVAISRSNPSTMYASIDNGSSESILAKSTNSGDTWTKVTGITDVWLSGQGWYDNAITVHPYNSNIVYAGGVNWYQININGTTGTSTILSTGVHSDQHGLHFEITDDANEIYYAINVNDGGVWYDADGDMQNFIDRFTGYTTGQFYGADRHPYLKRYTGGTQDNGSWKSNVDEPDGETNWGGTISGFDGYDAIWNKNDPDKMIATAQYNLTRRTLNGGDSWQDLFAYDSNVGYFLNNWDNYKTNPDAIYHPSRTQLYVSFDFGDSWLFYDNPSSWAAYQTNFTDVRISRANPTVVWYAAAMVNNTVSPVVSVDSGRTFTETNYYTGASFFISGLATHPTEQLTAYVLSSVQSPKVIRTEDLGITWENISGNLPDVDVYSLLVIPDTTASPFPIWVGTEIGIYVSEDDGATWQYADNGIPAVSVWEMRLVDNEVIVATHGRGVWSVELPNILINDEGVEINLEYEEFFIQNPSYQEYGFYAVQFNNPTRFREVVLVQDGSRTELDLQLYNESKQQYFAPITLNGTSDITIESSYLAFAGYDTVKNDLLITSIKSNGKQQIIGKNDVTFTIPANFEPGFQTMLRANKPIETTDNTITLYEKGFRLGFGQRQFSTPIHLSWSVNEELLTFGKLVRQNGDGWDSVPFTATQDGAIQADLPQEGTYALMMTDEINSLLDKGRLDYGLGQNFPNPFNPVTSIPFELTAQRHVNITVYNALGQKIRTLVNAVTPAGSHSVQWNGTNDRGFNVSSGIYFYRMQLGEKIITRKMNLIK